MSALEMVVKVPNLSANVELAPNDRSQKEIVQEENAISIYKEGSFLLKDSSPMQDRNVF